MRVTELCAGNCALKFHQKLTNLTNQVKQHQHNYRCAWTITEDIEWFMLDFKSRYNIQDLI